MYAIRNDSHVIINHVDNFNIMGDNAHITNIISIKGDIQDNLNGILYILNSENIDEDIKINIQNNVVVIKEELEKENFDLSKIQYASNMINSVVKNIAISAAANLLTQYIDELINLIDLLI